MDSGRFAVYILTNRRNGTLYIGVTRDLVARLEAHRSGAVAGFTRTHSVHRLVHVERFATAMEAIAREKQLKAWKRWWKVQLIEQRNPYWVDLSDRLRNRGGKDTGSQIEFGTTGWGGGRHWVPNRVWDDGLGGEDTGSQIEFGTTGKGEDTGSQIKFGTTEQGSPGVRFEWWELGQSSPGKRLARTRGFRRFRTGPGCASLTRATGASWVSRVERSSGGNWRTAGRGLISTRTQSVSSHPVSTPETCDRTARQLSSLRTRTLLER
ncbi:GIY-YIG nuclease family protein [Halomonas denitrificans]|nr:GIY-YIG nuclease family protein [Halomonas denitrificans]